MMFSDLVLYNGKIVTMDSKDSIAEAVAVYFNKIIAVGNSSDIQNVIGKEGKVIDLNDIELIDELTKYENRLTNLLNLKG